MHKRNLYEILGVERTATRKQIKKAYHKLAMNCHPDKCPDDPKAERAFKEIAEAYQVLICPDHREHYDIFGSNDRMGGSGREDVEDIFEQFSNVFKNVFDGTFEGGVEDEPTKEKRNTPQPGKDVDHNLELTFKEAIFGTKKKITLVQCAHCMTCEGSGAAPGTKAQKCSGCDGSGEKVHKQAFISFKAQCDQCSGSGKIVPEPCACCGGRGTRRERRKISISIPPGVNTGTRLKVANEGEIGDPGTKQGDLIVKLMVMPSDIYERDDLDIHFYASVSFIQAALGCTLKVPLLDDVEEVVLGPGTQHDDVFILEGQGIRHPCKKNHYGDFFVHINLQNILPHTEEHRALLNKLAEHFELPSELDLTSLGSD